MAGWGIVLSTPALFVVAVGLTGYAIPCVYRRCKHLWRDPSLTGIPLLLLSVRA